MRQLFVPACVCLMTWSGPTGSDAKLSLENFTGVSTVDKRADALPARKKISHLSARILSKSLRPS